MSSVRFEPSRREAISLLGAAAIGLAASPASAGILDGRSIRFLIGNEGSGGYEAYARLFARHFAATLPDATVTIEVVETADGRLAAKRIYEAAPGQLVIGLFESALLYAEVSGEEGVAFELGKFNWLGKLAVDERVVVVSKASGVDSLAELKARAERTISPVSTTASRASFESYILNAVLDLAIEPVAGYDGAQRVLAMISGEGQLVVGSYPSQRKLVNDEGAIIVLRLNAVPSPVVASSVPLLRDVAPKPISPLVDLIELSANLGRWIAAPPSAEPADVAALRKAFDDTVANEAFRAEAVAQEIPINSLPGTAVQHLVAGLMDDKSALQGSLAAAVACGKQHAAGARGPC